MKQKLIKYVYIINKNNLCIYYKICQKVNIQKILKKFLEA